MEFTHDTVKETISLLISRSRACRDQPKPKDVKNHFMVFELLDQDGKSVYRCSSKNTFKTLVRKMYKMSSGRVECFCRPLQS